MSEMAIYRQLFQLACERWAFCPLNTRSIEMPYRSRSYKCLHQVPCAWTVYLVSRVWRSDQQAVWPELHRSVRDPRWSSCIGIPRKYNHWDVGLYGLDEVLGDISTWPVCARRNVSPHTSITEKSSACLG